MAPPEGHIFTQTHIGKQTYTFQTSSPQKPLGQSKPKYIWSFQGPGGGKFLATSGSHEQDGRHAHMLKAL